MERKNLLIVLGLSLGLGVGAATGLAVGRETFEAKAEGETSWDAGTAIYIRHNSKTDYFNGDKLFINYQDTSNDWHYQEYTASNLVSVIGDSTNNLYRIVLEYSAKNIQVLRKAGSWSGTQHNYSNSSAIYSSTHNLYELTSWGSEDLINASFATAGIRKVTLSQPSHGTITYTNDNPSYFGEGYWYSNWGCTLSFAPETSAYYFDHWTVNGNEFDSNGTVNNLVTYGEWDLEYTAVVGDCATDCNAFQNAYLHMDDVAYDSVNAGLCDKIPDGETKDRYNLAKDAYNDLRSENKAYFSTNAAYADARARLDAWAIAHGERFTVTEGVGVLGSTMVSPLSEVSKPATPVYAVATITVVALLAAGGYVLALKRKEEK